MRLDRTLLRRIFKRVLHSILGERRVRSHGSSVFLSVEGPGDGTNESAMELKKKE